MDPKNLRISPVLSDHSIGWNTEKYSFIGDMLFPNVFVSKSTGKIATYGAENLIINETKVAYNSPSPEANITVSLGDHYDIDEHRLKGFVSDREQEEEDAPIDMKLDTTEALTEKMKLGYEYAIATMMRNASVLTNNFTPSVLWSTLATSDPIGDIKTAMTSVHGRVGFSPNTLALSWDVFQVLLIHPAIVARFPGAAVVTADMIQENLGRLFNPSLKRLLVGDVSYNSANEGQTASLTSMWTKDAWVAYVEPSPKKKDRSMGKTYRLKRRPDRVVHTWRHTDPDGEYIRVTDEFDVKLESVDCVELIDGAIA